MDFSDSSTFSTASGKDYHYVVLQVTLKEKFLGTGSGNLTWKKRLTIKRKRVIACTRLLHRTAAARV